MYTVTGVHHGTAFAIRASARTFCSRFFMWNLFNCYLSGRHDYGMWCEPGQMFLRCVHCGKRSSGWTIGGKPEPMSQPRPAPAVQAQTTVARVVPFPRTAAS